MSDEEARAELFDAVLTGLTSLIAGADERPDDTLFPKSALNLYDGFELLHRQLGHDVILVARDASDVPIWPMRAVWGGPRLNEEDIPEVPRGSWAFKLVETTTPKAWRGRLQRVMPRMVLKAEAFVAPSGKMVSSVAPLGIAGNKLVNCYAVNDPRADWGGARMGTLYGRKAAVAAKNDEIYDDYDFRIAQGIELRREYLWSVLMGEEGVPRARFVTDPIGVREAFRMRDIPPGKLRRAALRHWVKNHWRKNRETSERDRIFVREYLRGATAFGWNGLSCVIEPSRADLRRARKAA